MHFNRDSSTHDIYEVTLVRTIRVIMRKNDARTLHLCKWPHSCAKMIHDWYLSDFDFLQT